MPAPDIHVEHLSKAFHGTPVFTDISFQVDAGSVTSIIGPSGGGKSTLLRCLNRLETPDSGRIVVRGEPYEAARRLGAAQEQALHRQVGMVFQRFHLFPHLSTLRNVTLGQEKVLRRPRRKAEARALELLDRVGLADKAQARPRQLSGGQQQRVAIARALSLDPDILLFDEPTSALDPELGYEVLQVMKSLAHQGTTMVVVTHEMSFAQEVADQVLVLADGEIIEQGYPAAVFAAPRHDRTRRFLDHVRRV